MKNKLYVMCGCPGSGKSTYAKNMFPNARYISRDEIRFGLVEENEDYFSKENEVFKKFIEEINFGLNKNEDVVADATHLNTKSRIKLFSNLNIDKEKTEVHVIVMRTPLIECLRRNEKRKGTRSYVPVDVIKMMYNNFRKPNFNECNGMIDTIHTIEIETKSE